MDNTNKTPKIMLTLLTAASLWATGNISLVTFNNSYASSFAQTSRVRNAWKVLSTSVRKIDPQGKVEKALALITTAGGTYKVYVDCKRGVIDGKGNTPINQNLEANLVHDVCYRLNKR